MSALQEYNYTVLLEARGLAKRFGALVAVDGVSLSVAPGACTGLLGPNGAGKTTTVSMLAGLQAPDAGSVLLGGSPLAGDTDPKKKKVGLVPQDIALYEDLSAKDNLVIFGSLYELSPREVLRASQQALELVGLWDRRSDKVKTWSGGMKRRLNLAAALLHDPDLLILDEPTVGVDPQSRNAIFDNLEALRARGKGILYTTHYMEEAERLCQRIVIMDHGKVLADDTLAGLRGMMPPARKMSVTLTRPPAADAAWLGGLSALGGVEQVTVAADQLSLTLSELSVAAGVMSFLAEHGLSWSHFSSERMGLEGIFLSLTGRELRDS